MSSIKGFISPTLFACYVVVVALIILEIIFRILPASESFNQQHVDSQSPIIHFEPDRIVRKQIGFDFNHVNEKRVNNYGYLTDEHFTAKSRPVAVIGDSFVEAMQVPNNQTFHALLSQKHSDLSIYPISMSGAPLSQYLSFTTFAENEFDPTSYIFVIVENDFVESWLRYKSDPGFSYFDEAGELVLIEYNPSLLKSILRQSAFLRYIYLDLKIGANLGRWIDIINGGGSDIEVSTFSGRPSDSDRLQYAIRATELFLEKLQTIVKGKPVLLVFDGNRQSIYKNGIQSERSGIAHLVYERIIDSSRKYENVQIIDLQNDFLQSWLKDGIKFSFDYDDHWSKQGHKVVAQAIENSNFLIKSMGDE